MKSKYTVAISFADEQSELAETIDAFCKTHSIECYYYKREYAHTAGKILEAELTKIYQYEPCLTILLWSENYGKGSFTGLERELIFKRRETYRDSLMLVWADGNTSNAPPAEEGLGYVPWKGNQYGVFKEILERTEKCREPESSADKKFSPGHNYTTTVGDLQGGITFNG